MKCDWWFDWWERLQSLETSVSIMTAYLCMSSIWNEPYHISYANLCVLLLGIFKFNIHRIVSIKPLWGTCFVEHVYPYAYFHTHTTYEYTVPPLPQILANHESMHHNKHVFCVPLHVMHSWVPLHQMCKASCPQTAKSDLHAHMGICMTAWGKCIAFATACAWYAQLYALHANARECAQGRWDSPESQGKSV